MIVYIYSLADSRSPNNIRYIGKTTNLKDRLERHQQLYYLKEGSYKSRWINKVLKEGGKIIMGVIDEVIQDNWHWETYWIAQFKAWNYNLVNTTLGGKGCILTKEVLEKRNTSNKGRVFSEDTKRKISESQKGKVISDECKQKLREVNLGKKYNQETKGKLSAMRIGEGNHFFGKKHSKESLEKIGMNHPFRRAINQYDLEGNLLNTYTSSHEAGEKTGLARSTISRACKSEKQSKGGFIWKYVE